MFTILELMGSARRHLVPAAGVLEVMIIMELSSYVSIMALRVYLCCIVKLDNLLVGRHSCLRNSSFPRALASFLLSDLLYRRCYA